jgi:hypothetical protein
MQQNISMPVKRHMNWRTDRLKQNNVSVHAAKHLRARSRTTTSYMQQNISVHGQLNKNVARVAGMT